MTLAALDADADLERQPRQSLRCVPVDEFVLGEEVAQLFRLVQLDQVAERIVQEGLVPGAGDERYPVHLDALLLQIADGGIDVVDSDREVVRAGRLGIGLHQVHLLAAGVEPVPRAEIGARQLRHAERVTIEGETLLRVGDADGDVVYTGWLHPSILPQQQL